MPRCFLLLLFWLILGSGLSGQSDLKSHFVHLGVANGLPHENVLCIEEDQDGFIWVGTLHGLARYNGYDFDVYYPSVEPTSIPDGKVNDIFCSSSGDVWVATEGGLCKYLPERDEFQRFPDRTNGELDRLRSQVLCEDHLQRIWVGYEHLVPSEGGVSVLDPSTGNYQRYQTDLPKGVTFIQQDVNDQGLIWYGGTLGLSKLDIASGHCEVFVCPLSEGDGFMYWTGVQTESSLILPHLRGGVMAFHKEDESWEQLNNFSSVYTISLEDSTFYFSSTNKGYGSFSLAGNQRLAPVEKGSPFALPTQEVRCHLRDSYGRVWIGHNLGVSVWDPDLNQFNIKVIDEGMQSVINSNRFRRVIYVESMNRVLAASSKRGLFILDPISLEVGRELDFSAYEDEKPIFLDMLNTPEGPLLLSRKKLYTLDSLAQPVVRYSFEVSTDSLRPSHRLAYYSENRIAVNGRNDYLIEVDLENQSQQAYRLSPQVNERRNTVSGLAYAQDGSLWFSSYFGRGYLAPEADSLVYIPQSPRIGPNKTPAVLNACKSFGDTMLVHCTQMQGMIAYLIKQDTCISLGQTNNYWLHDFVSDQQDRLWAGTDRGLLCLDLKSNQEHWFSLQDGLPVSNLATYGISCDDLGQIWLSIEGRVISFHPDSILKQASNRPIRLQHVEIIGGDEYNNHALKSLKEIEIPWQHNDLRFSCTDLSLGSGNKSNIEYRLLDFNEEWTSTTTQGGGSFTNLPGGSYQLQLRKKGGEEAPVQLQVHVATPWYATWLFRGGVAAMVVLLFAGFYRMRIRSIQKENQLRSQQRRRVAELKMSALQGQMNPHFLFNSLNSIKHYIIRSDREEAADYITLFSTMIRKMLNHSRNETISLQDEADFLHTYLEMESMRFEKHFNYHIHIDDGLVPATFMIPPMLIQPYCENSIWHGLMRKEGSRELHVSFQKINRGVRCVVEDNGIGITAAQKLKSTSTQTRKSHGMSIVNERIELLNLRYKMEIVSSLEEVKDTEGKVQGTRVIIEIPNFNGTV